MPVNDPARILDECLEQVSLSLKQSVIVDENLRGKLEFICRYLNNRAPVRLILSCSLAKAHNLQIDIRKPYTELGSRSYSGRFYDEQYITSFINHHDLPCHPTTAFLTPALRAKNITLTVEVDLGGRPKEVYLYAIQLLEAVEDGRISAVALLAETIRYLLLVRNERKGRMVSLLLELQQVRGDVPLSSQEIVTLIHQHLTLPNASRLPVLVVAAAYRAASQYLREQILPLESHTAADEQTGALGDLEITVIGDDRVVTTYEMKMKRVTIEDIDRAVHKILNAGIAIQNYVFITADTIDESVSEYARSIYRQTGGIEFVILDCIGFLRHFLHLFHRLRLQFLDAYQELVLQEPESAVRQPLKEAFLALRRAAESADPGEV